MVSTPSATRCLTIISGCRLSPEHRPLHFPSTLQADLDDLEPRIDVGSVSAWCVWHVDEQRFIPMPELQARTAAMTQRD